jgi:hypothetical protein
LIDCLDAVLDAHAKLPVVLPFLTLHEALILDLIIIELFHFHPLLVLSLSSVLILDLALNQVIEGKNIPSVIGLWLNLPFSTRLEACLGEVQTILLVQSKVTLSIASLRVLVLV